MPSAITGTPLLSASPTGYPGTNSQLSPAIQVIWSKEILFQSMPVLRFEQFAVKKTELGVQPGLQVNFMRYNNLGDATQLVEGVRMQTAALTASQYAITVAEQGYAVAVSELLLNSSFDDVMASSSRLLGRNMAKYLDGSARDTLYTASSVLWATSCQHGADSDAGLALRRRHGGYERCRPDHRHQQGPVLHERQRRPRTPWRRWPPRTCPASVRPMSASSTRTSPAVCVTTRSSSRSRSTRRRELHARRDRSSQRRRLHRDHPDQADARRPPEQVRRSSTGALYLGDNAFGHAIALPVELRDGGVLDFGREHALAWYAIWGFGLITDQAVVIAQTN